MTSQDWLVGLAALAVIGLCFAVWCLSRSLVSANLTAYNGWRRAMQHALAINIHERERMRLELEMDRAEFLLREQREKAGIAPGPSRKDREEEKPHDHDDVTIKFDG